MTLLRMKNVASPIIPSASKPSATPAAAPETLFPPAAPVVEGEGTDEDTLAGPSDTGDTVGPITDTDVTVDV